MPSREAIIHIGTMKTGTSAIQEALRRSKNMLAANRAHFSSTIHVDHHHPWRFIVHGQRVSRGEQPPMGGIPPDWQDRVQHFEARVTEEMKGLKEDVERVFFSDEQLNLTLRTPDEIAALKVLLAPYFDRFSIVVYLRPQPSYLASRYSQSLRLRQTSAPPSIDPPARELPEYDYNALLENWGSVFGEPSLRPRLYERDTNKSFSSVDDFFSMFGLQNLLPDAGPAKPVHQSMNVVGQELLREIARQLRAKGTWGTFDWLSWVDICQAVTNALPGSGWQPTRAEAKSFMARYEVSNEAVRQRFFAERDVLFADEWDHYAEEAPPPPSDRQLVEAACSTFAIGFNQLRQRAPNKVNG